MEKYGTIPDRFTKEWWDYIWYYYKWHILGTAFALTLIIVTAVQMASQIDYDATVTFAGNGYFSDESVEMLQSSMSEHIDDVDKDDRNTVFFQQINLTDQSADAQFAYAMQIKFTTELQAGESFLFLMTKDKADEAISYSSADGLFLKISEWSGDESEKGYYYNLHGNKFFEDAGVNTDDLYLVVRNLRYNEVDDDEFKAKFENAKKLANYIVSCK